MPVVRGGYGDSIDLLLVENPAEVLLGDRGLAHLLPGAVGKLAQDVAVDIADIRNAGRIFVRFQRRQVGVAAAIQAYDRKVDALVGADNLGITLRCSLYRQSRCANCQRIEELPSRNHRHSSGLPIRIVRSQQEIPAFVNIYLSPSTLTRVEASGVPAPRQ